MESYTKRLSTQSVSPTKRFLTRSVSPHKASLPQSVFSREAVLHTKRLSHKAFSHTKHLSTQSVSPTKRFLTRSSPSHVAFHHSTMSPVAHFDELVYPAQATPPQEPDQLRLNRHMARTPPRPQRQEPSCSRARLPCTGHAASGARPAQAKAPHGSNAIKATAP